MKLSSRGEPKVLMEYGLRWGGSPTVRSILTLSQHTPFGVGLYYYRDHKLFKRESNSIDWDDLNCRQGWKVYHGKGKEGIEEWEETSIYGYFE